MPQLTFATAVACGVSMDSLLSSLGDGGLVTGLLAQKLQPDGGDPLLSLEQVDERRQLVSPFDPMPDHYTNFMLWVAPSRNYTQLTHYLVPNQPKVEEQGGGVKCWADTGVTCPARIPFCVPCGNMADEGTPMEKRLEECRVAVAKMGEFTCHFESGAITTAPTFVTNCAEWVKSLRCVEMDGHKVVWDWQYSGQGSKGNHISHMQTGGGDGMTVTCPIPDAERAALLRGQDINVTLHDGQREYRPRQVFPRHQDPPDVGMAAVLCKSRIS
jgi:hypothetical protein